MPNVEITREWLLARCICQPSGCWTWKFRTTKHGYGQLSRQRHGKVMNLNAHRVAYATFIGPIPDGLMVCHSCDNRRCINPNHLFLGTATDNMRDAVTKGRLRIPSHRPRGEANANAKLTAHQVAEIRRLKGQYSRSALAIKYGVSLRCIGMIHSGKTWTTLGTGA